MSSCLFMRRTSLIPPPGLARGAVAYKATVCARVQWGLVTNCPCFRCGRGNRRLRSMLISVCPLDRGDRLGKRASKHFIDMADGNDLEPFADRRRNFSQIFLVLGRDQHRVDAATKSREELLLQASDRKHATA